MNYSNSEPATALLHWVRITIHSAEYTGDIIKVLVWRDLPWAVRVKWSWYFKYRAALEQVHHPRSRVNMTWGNSPAEGKTLLLVKKERVTSRKREVTRISNAIKKHEEYMSTFLIWEKDQDKDYQKALAKLDRVQNELRIAEEELKDLQSGLK